MIIPIFIRSTNSKGFGRHIPHADWHGKEQTKKFGPITEARESGKIGWGEVVRGGKVFLKCKISNLEIPKEGYENG